MDTTRIVQVEIALPNAKPVSGELEIPVGTHVVLDDVAIEIHRLVNDLVQSIRRNKPVVDGKDT